MTGINYYHESLGFIVRTLPQMREDMASIAEKYNAVKIGHEVFSQDRLKHAIAAAAIAKEYGLYVVWTEFFTGANLADEAAWNNYMQRVVKDLISVNQTGSVDEFLVGNELSIHVENVDAFSDVNLPAKVKTLVRKCQEMTSITISYQEGWWKKDAWLGAKLDSMPKIYFTLYEDLAGFQDYLNDIRQKYGDRAAIGEWSSQGTLDQQGGEEHDWLTELINRRRILEASGLSSFYFCFRDTGMDNNGRGFGMFTNNPEPPHPFWFA